MGMGITLDVTSDPRIWVQSLDGQISRRDHSTLNFRVADLCESGKLAAMIVDSRRVRDYPPISLLREIWNDGLEVLAGRHVAYLPPKGHDEELERLLQVYVDEWDITYQRFEAQEQAEDWCRDQLEAAGSAR